VRAVSDELVSQLHGIGRAATGNVFGCFPEIDGVLIAAVMLGTGVGLLTIFGLASPVFTGGAAIGVTADLLGSVCGTLPA
jgi:hypothetical protein